MVQNKTSKKIICRDHFGKEYQVTADQLIFRPAIYGIIIKNNKILLSKQWDGYDLPGGGIELGETFEAALTREVKEETGFNVKVGDLVTCQTSFFRSRSGKNLHSIHLYHFCKIISGEISTEFLDENEKTYAAAAEWHDLTEISKMKFYSSVNLNKLLNRFVP